MPDWTRPVTTPDEPAPTERRRRHKAWVLARLLARGALRSEIDYLRRLLIFFAGYPMVFFAFAPPDAPLDYRPDAGAWTCRISIGAIMLVANGGVLLPQIFKRYRRLRGTLYLLAIALIVVGTPLSYLLRRIFID